MITKQSLLQIVYEQNRVKTDVTIPRRIDPKLLSCPEVLIITGVRRCGKSTLLRQIQQRSADRDYYINFDDERLINFTVEDFQTLNEVFFSEFGEQHTYYFDEIQNVPGWERFVDRLYTTGNKVYVTGSNAKLLSRELGTLLTGRHVTMELYPFSFHEFMSYRGYEYDRKDFHTTAGRSRLGKHFAEYLRDGGFPQYLNNGSDIFLKSLYRHRFSRCYSPQRDNIRGGSARNALLSGQQRNPRIFIQFRCQQDRDKKCGHGQQLDIIPGTDLYGQDFEQIRLKSRRADPQSKKDVLHRQCACTASWLQPEREQRPLARKRCRRGTSETQLGFLLPQQRTRVRLYIKKWFRGNTGHTGSIVFGRRGYTQKGIGRSSLGNGSI